MKKNIKKQKQDPNQILPYETPQNVESERLADEDTADAVERKDKKKEDHGETRGGNLSVNQGH
jgi:hypothetical protein